MAGSGDDPNKRIGMLWDQEENAILPPPGTTKAEYVFPGVSEQAGDPDSILSYYREALAIRTAFPQIARGNSRDAGSEDPRVSLLLRGEMFPSDSDNKLRYLAFQRRKFYAAFNARISRFFKGTPPLYMCMEKAFMWSDMKMPLPEEVFRDNR